ncbi:hypothetical protein BST61_g7915 [Cercospora zeina]
MEARRDRTVFGYPPPQPRRTPRVSAAVPQDQPEGPDGQLVDGNILFWKQRSKRAAQLPGMSSSPAVDTPVEAHFTHSSHRESTERDLCPSVPDEPSPTMHEHFRMLRAKKEDMVTLTVSASLVEFEIPLEALVTTSRLWKRHIRPDAGNDAYLTSSELNATKTESMHLPTFVDFTHWLYSGKIIQYAHNGVSYAVASDAKRLIEAIGFGLKTQSESYQRAALEEFYQLGPHIENPEEYADLMLATAGQVYDPVESNGNPRKSARRCKPHPACWLIVAIVAAKRVGLDRDPPHYEHIHDRDFIQMFTLWYKKKGGGRAGGCQYPSTLSEALMGVEEE